MSALRMFCFIILCCASHAYASADKYCKLNGGDSDVQVGFSFNDVNFAAATQPGAVIATANVDPSSNTFSASGDGCYRFVEMMYSTSKTSQTDTYETNVPGIGIKVTYGGSLDARWPAYYSGKYGSGGKSAAMTAKVELIVTGTVKAGILNTGQVGRQYLSSDSKGSTGPSVILVLTAPVPIGPSCTLTSNPDMHFALGNVDSSQFSSPGSTSAQTATQNIDLKCDAGVSVSATLQGNQNPDSSDTSILALSKVNNSATGVGVQLLYQGNLLHLNQTIDLLNSNGGEEIIPITARYIQTDDKITAGEADSTATINIIYN